MTDSEYDEQYNNYVLSNGIHSKVEAESTARVLSDMRWHVYTHARRLIRERSGMMLSTKDAIKILLKDKEAFIKQINDEMLADRLNNNNNDPQFAMVLENLKSDKDEETRKSAERLLDLMIAEAESFD